MRSAVGVGRTDATLDCIATGGFLDPSALVKALPSSFHLFAHQRSAGYKSLKKKKLTTFVVQLPQDCLLPITSIFWEESSRGTALETFARKGTNCVLAQ